MRKLARGELSVRGGMNKADLTEFVGRTVAEREFGGIDGFALAIGVRDILLNDGTIKAYTKSV